MKSSTTTRGQSFAVWCLLFVCLPIVLSCFEAFALEENTSKQLKVTLVEAASDFPLSKQKFQAPAPLPGCRFVAGRFWSAKPTLLQISQDRLVAVDWRGATEVSQSEVIPSHTTPHIFTHLVVGDFDQDSLDEILGLTEAGEIFIADGKLGEISREILWRSVGNISQKVLALGVIKEAVSLPAELYVIHDKEPFEFTTYRITNEGIHQTNNLSLGLGVPSLVLFPPQRSSWEAGFLMFIKDNEMAVNIGSNHRFSHHGASELWSHLSMTKRGKVISFSDVNGDGFSDLLVSQLGADRWDIIYGGERGAVPKGIPALPPGLEYFSWDLNEDGFDDLVGCTGEESSGLSIFLSKVDIRQLSADSIDSKALQWILNGMSNERHAEVVRDFQVAEANVAAGSSEPSDFVSYIASWWETVDEVRVVIRRFPKTSGQGIAVAPGGFLDDRYPGPFVCDGFNPGNGEDYGLSRDCSTGYAVVSVDDPNLSSADALYYYLNCCRLPHSGVLVHRHEPIVLARNCPDGHVAIAVEKGEDGKDVLRCRALTDQFALGEAMPGIYWGKALSYRGQKRSMTSQEIPPALRTGVMRRGSFSYDNDGCIAETPGALLVGIGDSPRCEELKFRPLMRRTPSGLAPVEMFPKCRHMPSPWPEFARCD